MTSLRKRLLTAGLLLVVLAPGCRLLSQEIACRRDRDCPKDVGFDFCDSPGDGGAGVCVDVDPNPETDGGDNTILDASIFNPPTDGGPGEGGPGLFP
jgi:hypothetical protein